MPSLNFTVFIDEVEDGTKPQSIRRYTDKKWKMFKNAIGKKDKLSLFTGLRTRACRLLRRATVTEVIPIYFMKHRSTFDGSVSWYLGLGYPEPSEYLRDITGLYSIATRDGFQSWDELIEWFLDHYGHDILTTEPFMIIRWE